MRQRMIKKYDLWVLVDKDGWTISFSNTPKETRRLARVWWLYLTAPTDELAMAYLNGEIKVK